MPPKKASKKQKVGTEKGGTAGKAGGKPDIAAKNSAEVTPSFSTTATLDIASHPYILSLIIDFSPRSTLLALLRCSKDLFESTAPSVYKHLRLTHKQFDKMIEVGNAPAKRGSTSGILGRAFSPYLKEGLQRVRMLYISDFGVKWTPPAIPRGCLTEVSSLVIRRQITWQQADRRPYDLPTRFLGRLPHTLKHLTILVDTPWRQFWQATGFATLEAFAQGSKTLTIVLLPSLEPGPSPYHTVDESWRKTSRFWKGFTAQPSATAPNSNIRIVGSEYSGRKVKRQSSPGELNSSGLSFIRFTDWVNSQPPGAMFSAKEEVTLRRANKACLAAVRDRALAKTLAQKQD